MYKYATPEVTTNLGIILLFTSFISISLYPLMARVLHFFFHNFNLGHDSLVSLSAIHLAFILVISIYSLYGLVDDLVDVGRILKLTLPVVFAYPLVSVVDPSHVWVPLLGELNLQSKIYLEVTISDIFRITVIPFTLWWFQSCKYAFRLQWSPIWLIFDCSMYTHSKIYHFQ